MKKNEQTTNKQTTNKQVQPKQPKQPQQPKQLVKPTKQVGPTKSIKKPEMSVREKERKEIVKLFKSGKTVYQIAKKLGKYYSQIAPILESEGLTWTKRPAGPTNKRNYSIYCSPDQYKQVKELLKSNK